jgi:hypothetical protein
MEPPMSAIRIRMPHWTVIRSSSETSPRNSAAKVLRTSSSASSRRNRPISAGRDVSQRGRAGCTKTVSMSGRSLAQRSVSREKSLGRGKKTARAAENRRSFPEPVDAVTASVFSGKSEFQLRHFAFFDHARRGV